MNEVENSITGHNDVNLLSAAGTCTFSRIGHSILHCLGLSPTEGRMKQRAKMLKGPLDDLKQGHTKKDLCMYIDGI